MSGVYTTKDEYLEEKEKIIKKIRDIFMPYSISAIIGKDGRVITISE